MKRTEYMRLKGELTCAEEAHEDASTEAWFKHGDLRSATEIMLGANLPEAVASRAHTLIDELLALQQRATYWKAQEAKFKQRLEGQTPPVD